MASSSRSPRSSPSLRLFWGIAPAEGLRSRATAWRPAAESLLPGARWVHPADLHVTLAFLGSRPAFERDPILSAGRAALAGRSPLTLRTTHLGGFPSERHCRILWLGLEPEPSLTALAEALQDAMLAFGCPREAGPYRPHLSLARFKAPVHLPALAALEGETWVAGAVHLFQSEPHAAGPRYRSLGSVPLSPSSLPAP
jgi:2'-5' RNA ligase